jgi:hypothetical protein
MALAAAVTRALLDTRLPRVSVDAAIEDADAGDIELDADTLVGVPVDASRLPAILSTCQVSVGCVMYNFLRSWRHSVEHIPAARLHWC